QAFGTVRACVGRWMTGQVIALECHPCLGTTILVSVRESLRVSPLSRNNHSGTTILVSVRESLRVSPLSRNNHSGKTILVNVRESLRVSPLSRNNHSGQCEGDALSLTPVEEQPFCVRESLRVSPLSRNNHSGQCEGERFLKGLQAACISS
ncbi:hypothetical protein RRG08_004625, partial [Elysia crispata]